MALEKSSLPFGVGAAVGAGAYVFEYLLVYLVGVDDAREALSGFNAIVQFFGGDPVPPWKIVGWILYNAHFVSIVHPTAMGGQGSRNLIASGDVPAALYVVPVVFLLGAGAALAYRVGVTEPKEAAKIGASVSLGYLLLAIVGAFVFGVARGDATIAPDLITAVLLAGVVYPVVFGALGGAGYALVAQRRREPAGTTTD